MFVDRDGKHFRHILNWLRDGVVPTLKDSQYSELLREAEYYQLLVSGVWYFTYSVFPSGYFFEYNFKCVLVHSVAVKTTGVGQTQ